MTQTDKKDQTKQDNKTESKPAKEITLTDVVNYAKSLQEERESCVQLVANFDKKSNSSSESELDFSEKRERARLVADKKTVEDALKVIRKSATISRKKK